MTPETKSLIDVDLVMNHGEAGDVQGGSEAEFVIMANAIIIDNEVDTPEEDDAA